MENMTDIVNKKKKVSIGNIIKLLFIIIGLFLLSWHILSKIDRAVKKDMMYEILLQYVAEHDDKIDIKNSIVKDIKVDYDIYDVYYFGDKNRNMNIFTIFKRDCLMYILPTATMIMKCTIITTMTIILKNMM